MYVVRNKFSAGKLFDEQVITYEKALSDVNWAAYNNTLYGNIGLTKCFCKNIYESEGYTA